MERYTQKRDSWKSIYPDALPPEPYGYCGAAADRPAELENLIEANNRSLPQILPSTVPKAARKPRASISCSRAS